MIFRRYLLNTRYVTGAAADASRKRFLALVSLFRKYGSQYSMALKRMLPVQAPRIGEWANTISNIALVGIVLVLIAIQFGTILPLLWQSLPLVVAFATGSLLIGHVLGGPDPREQTALAIATVTRHPGLALLIATSSFPNLQVLPPILSVIIGCTIVSIPYMACWPG